MNNNTMPDNNTYTNNNDNNNMTILTLFYEANPYYQLLSLLQKSIFRTESTHYSGTTNCSGIGTLITDFTHRVTLL